jgi:ATP-dependent Lon protease
MSTYYEDLKINNPKKYADLRIAGNSDKVVLKNMVRALSILPWLNTSEDELRLAAAKRLLRNRY